MVAVAFKLVSSPLIFLSLWFDFHSHGQSHASTPLESAQHLSSSYNLLGDLIIPTSLLSPIPFSSHLFPTLLFLAGACVLFPNIHVSAYVVSSTCKSLPYLHCLFKYFLILQASVQTPPSL
jgi:hypothetical protein